MFQNNLINDNAYFSKEEYQTNYDSTNNSLDKNSLLTQDMNDVYTLSQINKLDDKQYLYKSM